MQAGEPAPAGGKMHRVLLGDRVVALCHEHAAATRQRKVDSVAELRDLFTEMPGGRSLVDRRSPLDRRVFPPRPEGRRRAAGRRTSDPTG